MNIPNYWHNVKLSRLRFIAITVTFLAFLITGCIATNTSTSKTNVQPAFATTGSVPVVVLAGSNYEMGYQLGQQTAPRIVHNIAVFKSAVVPIYGADTIKKDMEATGYYIKKYVPSMTEWFNGVVDGCKAQGYDVDYQDLVLIQSFDVPVWARPKKAYPPEAVMHCTSAAATGKATKDGKTYVMTTLMTGPTGFDKLIVVAFPKEGNSFIANTSSGLLVATSGMNSKGFAWIITAAGQVDPTWGIPAMPIDFHITQNISSPKEAEKWIASVPRGGATGQFILTDATGYISVLEANSQRYAIRHIGDLGENNEWVINANHFVTPEMKPYNAEKWSPDSKYRYATAWEYFSAAGPKSIDLGFFKNVFSTTDWYDPDTKKWNYNAPESKNVLGNFHIESTTVFCPNDLTMYAMMGAPSMVGYPAYSPGEFIKLKIGKSPAVVVGAAVQDTLGYYLMARTLFLKAKNSKAAYLDAQNSAAMQEKLNQAMQEWQLGQDRAGLAMTSKDPKAVLPLLGEALTHFVNSQVYSQSVTTQLSMLAKK